MEEEQDIPCANPDAEPGLDGFTVGAWVQRNTGPAGFNRTDVGLVCKRCDGDWYRARRCADGHDTTSVDLLDLVAAAREHRQECRV